jgi:Holliday junction resolvase RusA-like endonuclease
MEENELLIELDIIPPTTNKLYITLRNGRRTLSTEGKNFINLVKQRLKVLNLKPINTRACYSFNLELRLPWEDIFTKSYPKCDSPFQRLDTNNRIKLIKDTIKDCLGLKDDSQVFCDRIKKIAVDDDSRVGTKILLKRESIEDFIEVSDPNIHLKLIANYNYYTNLV